VTSWRAIWRDVLVRSWRLEKRATVVVCLLIAGQVTGIAVTGVALRTVVAGVTPNRGSQLLVASLVAAAGLGLGWFGGYSLLMLRTDLSDRIGFLQIDPEVQRLTAGLDGLGHLERADFMDRLSLLAGKGQVLVDAGWGVVESAALAGQILIILILLATVQPVLAALILFAVPGTLLGGAGDRRVRDATLAAAQPSRMEKHLHEVTTRAAAGKEIRVTGAAPALLAKAAGAWSQATAIQARARLQAAALTAAGSAVFILGYAAALAYVTVLVHDHQRNVADLVLVAVLAGQLQGTFGMVMGKRSQIQAGLALAEPYAWLRAHARQEGASMSRAPAPVPLRQGITLRQVTFGYPGSGRQVLGPVDVHLPAGAVVAVVGEYGSGKTTLIKLLCKFYQPASGRIEVDGIPLSSLDTASWRAATTAAFQDFGRYQVKLRHAVGFGDLPAAGDDQRLLAALGQAGADDLPRALAGGLDAQLGDQFDGQDLSEGQWQKTALARACMRQGPLLVVLDEPTASLDAPSEHAIFQRHAELARRYAERLGTITVVVSHRFSTVRMADLIIVLDQGRIIEQGSHPDLMRSGGTYAQLYRLQAEAYQLTGEGQA
jgi:ATP-binding cassette, subfamily B, bacterial